MDLPIVSPPSFLRPWRGAYVSYQGLSTPCRMVVTPDRIAPGDAARSGVEAVRNGPACREFRDALSSESPPEVCRSCSIDSGTF